MKNITGMDAHY